MRDELRSGERRCEAVLEERRGDGGEKADDG